MTDCEQLKILPKLAHLDLKSNCITDKDNIVPFVADLPQITSLYLLNNPCVRLLSNLRRQLVLASDTLYYLDDRPITELERKCIKAYEEGGKEAEAEVRRQAEIEFRNKLRCGFEKNKQIEDESRIERKAQFKRMMAEVKQEKEALTNKLEALKHRMKNLDQESPEYRKLYSEKYQLEREVRQDWYQKLKKRNEDVPVVMGRSALQTSKEFVEDYDRRYQEEMEARREAQANPKNIAQLHAEEEKKEHEYRREEARRNMRRQAGLAGGQPAGAVIPAAINPNDSSNNSGNSSGGGAVSGTDSESEPDTQNRMVKDLTAVNWTKNVEQKLEEILIRNAFDFKLTAKEFQRFMNDSTNPDSLQTVFYKIDAKTLQVKWTEIEVRKHVIPQMQQEQSADGAADDDENLEDDLPPLEEEPARATVNARTSFTDNRKAPSPERMPDEDGEQDASTTQEEAVSEAEIASRIK